MPTQSKPTPKSTPSPKMSTLTDYTLEVANLAGLVKAHLGRTDDLIAEVQREEREIASTADATFQQALEVSIEQVVSKVIDERLEALTLIAKAAIGNLKVELDVSVREQVREALKGLGIEYRPSRYIKSTVDVDVAS